jgi:hypothetical protein
MKKAIRSRLHFGVTGFHEELVGKIDFFEMDSFDPALKSLFFRSNLSLSAPAEFGVHISANHYYFRPESPIPLYDRVQALIEICESANAKACVLKLTPSFFETQNLESVIIPFQIIWNARTQINLWVDLPNLLPTSLSTNLFLATDPFCHKKKTTGYWRIHGWAESRWVRRYGEETLKTLAKDCVRFKPMFLVFAHSQRVNQILEFSRIYGVNRNPFEGCETDF